jgi:membrane-anchored protein YejM (alkaline phosphatase superfamily)
LADACDVVCDVYGASHTLVYVFTTASLYPELKNSSDKHPVTLPMIPNRQFPADPAYH